MRQSTNNGIENYSSFRNKPECKIYNFLMHKCPKVNISQCCKIPNCSFREARNLIKQWFPNDGNCRTLERNRKTFLLFPASFLNFSAFFPFKPRKRYPYLPYFLTEYSFLFAEPKNLPPYLPLAETSLVIFFKKIRVKKW